MIGNLSGGQQQRVMVARALAAEPAMLILDEPTAGIDAKGSEDFYRLLRQLNQDSGITVLLVSHDIDRVAAYAKTMLHLDEGVKYYGPAELYRQKPAVYAVPAEGRQINARYSAV
jgi:zinc transport system ATP-binding protein